MAIGLSPPTAEECSQEIAQLLAIALQRLRRRQVAEKASNSSGLANNSLDFRGQESVHAEVVGDSENRHAR